MKALDLLQSNRDGEGAKPALVLKVASPIKSALFELAQERETNASQVLLKAALKGDKELARRSVLHARTTATRGSSQ